MAGMFPRISRESKARAAVGRAEAEVGIPSRQMVQQYFSRAWLTSFSPTECSAVITACGNKKLWPKALGALACMQSAILVPDVVICTAALVACARSEEAERALSLFEKIPELQVQPSEVTYGAAIQACSRCSRWQRALHLQTFPDARNSFGASSAVGACGNAGHWNIALAILEDGEC